MHPRLRSLTQAWHSEDASGLALAVSQYLDLSSPSRTEIRLSRNEGKSELARLRDENCALRTRIAELEMENALLRDSTTISCTPPAMHVPKSPVSPAPTPPPSKPRVLAPDLPIEIVADIMDHVGDWELARAVGVPTSLPRPSAWSLASPVDLAMLTGSLALIRAADPVTHLPTIGADLCIRFGYVHVLEYFLVESLRLADNAIFKKIYKNDCIPIKASLHGRLEVLSWWKHGMERHADLLPSPTSISQALHNASCHGKVLEWWDRSRLPLQYRLCDIEEALEDAIGGGEAARDWWRSKGVNFNANDNEWMKLQNLN
ncbi:unnamed protein product [Mycena citricolor]|uniref:Uncharacterized protein n=1 Tax=Mycena citricolor TaxID=2018698 RepID=A0AAD2K6M0_9AGAR|nr:unnamed protein product [Mycena citricolor]